RQVAAAGMTGALENQVHERTTPEASTAGGIGADVLARFGDQRVAGHAAERRVCMRLRPRACDCEIPAATLAATAERVVRHGIPRRLICGERITYVPVGPRLLQLTRCLGCRCRTVVDGSCDGRGCEQCNRHRTQQYRRPS